MDALIFKVVVDNPKEPPTHSSYRTEGHINEALEQHLKTCKECRETIVHDLLDFAMQLLESGGPVQ
jgi:hypothetical protein